MTREVKCKDGWRSSTRLIFRVSPHQPSVLLEIVSSVLLRLNKQLVQFFWFVFKLMPVQSAQTPAGRPVSLWSCHTERHEVKHQSLSSPFTFFSNTQYYLSVCLQSWCVEMHHQQRWEKITHLSAETVFLSLPLTLSFSLWPLVWWHPIMLQWCVSCCLCCHTLSSKVWWSWCGFVLNILFSCSTLTDKSHRLTLTILIYYYMIKT